MSIFWLADKLGKFVHEIEDNLTIDEVADYLAYYTIQAEEEKQEADKIRKSNANKGRRR